MEINSGYINRLIEELERLPGIGNKSAQRMAYYIVSLPNERVEKLTSAIDNAKKHTHYCKECLTMTDSELCPVCADKQRDHKTIMVVENPRDLAAYEKTGKYRGVYHVLHGAISPMLGIGPADIRLKELISRLEGDIDEVIIATVPSDATGSVMVDIDGIGYYGTIVNGKAKIIIPELSAGKYKATVTYEGDDKYLPSTTTTSFTVSKSKAPISADADKSVINIFSGFKSR